ncbi:MAG: 3-oxoacyl-[acyl-carrier-protein] reductase [Planctomycetaceae bacterium]
MKKLENRVALVTGAGRGIGRAISQAFAAENATVAVTARSQDELDSLVADITAAGGRAVAFPADLSDRSTTRNLVGLVKEQLGPVDILVNNAGIGSSSQPQPVVDYSEDFWDLTMELNLTAPMILSKAVLPDMLGRNWGRIITIASINGRVGSFHGAAYAASKHGVMGLMKTIAMETAAHGVTANCICPGPVKTLMNEKRVEYDAERLGRNFEEYEASLTPIGGRLVPEDIAPMAVFLASDEARAITGQGYNICGGLVMT